VLTLCEHTANQTRKEKKKLYCGVYHTYMHSCVPIYVSTIMLLLFFRHLFTCSDGARRRRFGCNSTRGSTSFYDDT
jgi:predicted  nucleic acid-binding Zn ribbon protein